MEKEKKSFTPETLVPLEEKLYDHGYSLEEVEEIKRKKENIDKRDIISNPITLEEMKNAIIPYIRIHRTEVFVLQKPKEKKERVKKEKVVKPKKLTKKQINAKIDEIIFKKLKGEILSNEDEEFLKTHAGEDFL